MTSRWRVSFPFYLLFILMVSPVFAADDSGTLQAAFLRGEYEKILRSEPSGVPEGSDGADALAYLKGVSALKLGDAEMARSLLLPLVENRPKSRWAAQGWLALGESWETSGNQVEALKVYSRYLEEGKDDSMRPQVLLRMGMVQRQMGQWDEAKKTLAGAAAKESGIQSQASEVLNSEEFYYTVQVGAFATDANADRLAAELKRRGYDARLSEMTTQGKTLHRVRVGRFSSRTEAEQQAKQLKQDGFPAKVFP